jgi:outer membrane protein assembly factor BamD
MFGKFLCAVAVFFSITALGACVAPPTEQKREAYLNFDDANRYFAEGKFDVAQKYYQKVTDEAPDSPFRIHALLGQADSFFLQGEYIAAAPLYARFQELYPLDPRTSYAEFYQGMSYFRDVVAVKRDQSSTQKAYDLLVKFAEKYPEHPATQFAKEKTAFLKDRLSEKIYTIAKYYFDTASYGACIGRVEDLLEKFPDTRFKAEALLMKGKSLAAEEAFGKAELVFKDLIVLFPETPFATQATAELAQIKKN